MNESTLSSSEFAVAGAVSGFTTRFCCQPLDVLKILFQLQAESRSQSKYRSLHQALALIVREEGWAALWKGHVPAQYLSVLYGAVQFTSYEKIVDFTRKYESQSAFLSGTAFHFYAGSAAGVLGTICSFPFDTVRTQLVAQHKSKLYKGVLDAYGKIWLSEGTRGFFKGLLPACVLVAPSAGMTFGFKYIYTHIWMSCMGESMKMCDVSAKGHIVTGLLAGITAKTLVYPLDLLKKRLQVQGMDESFVILKSVPRCRGLKNCALLILKHEGILGFYKGVAPAIIKSGVTHSINFTLYHQLCNLIQYVKR